jgi:hypothetical protein
MVEHNMDDDIAAKHRFWSERQDPKWVRVLNILSTIAVLVILAILTAWLVHALFVSNPPLIVDQPLLVDKELYYPGDDIEITGNNLCRQTDAPGTAYVTYYEVNLNKAYQVFSRPANAAPLECVDSFTVVEQVPLVPHGRYERRSVIVYDIGFGINREIRLRTVPFEVLPIE